VTAAVVLTPLPAARADEPVRDHTIVAEDYFTLAFIQYCAASPDGRFVAYTDMRWEPPAEKRNTDIWVVACDSRRAQRLTFDPAGDGNAQWSPDSRWVYFSSGRKREGETRPPYDGKPQVWRVSVDGGDEFPVTRVDGGIESFELSQDGDAVYYTKSAEEQEDEWKDLKTEFAHIEYGHGTTHAAELWKLDLNTWRSEKLVAEKRYIRYFAVSPDERYVGMITDPTDALITHEGRSRVDVYDASSRKVITLPDQLWRVNAPSPYGWLGDPAWSSDSRVFAFTVMFDGYPTQLFAADFSGAEPQVWRLNRPAGIEVMGTLHWRPGSRDLAFRAEHRARCRVYCIRDVGGGRQGADLILTPGDVAVDTFSFTGTGEKLAYGSTGPASFNDLFLISALQPDQQPAQLTDVNPQATTWELPQLSLVQWRGADGADVEGILELPPAYKPGDGPLPLVVELHGGPTASTLYSLRFWIYGRTLFAAQGYALLSPNYRGSTGYGDKFLTDLIGRENDIEVKDILAGVDALVERGLADPEKLGVMGWSNGGFLTNAVITQSPRFKAASSGAGIIDQLMQWGTEDTPGHVINFTGGFPWQQPAVYRQASPIYVLDRVRTPTIIHVGGADPRVPPAHSRTLYRGLKEYVGVPTELLVYPDEEHSLSTYQNRLAKMKWDLAWFDKYLRGHEPG